MHFWKIINDGFQNVLLIQFYRLEGIVVIPTHFVEVREFTMLNCLIAEITNCSNGYHFSMMPECLNHLVEMLEDEEREQFD